MQPPFLLRHSNHRVKERRGKGKGKKGKGGGDSKSSCDDACEDPTFLFNPAQLTWDDHEDIAKKLGCHLASIHSDEEQEQVYIAAGSSNTRAWLGGVPPKGRKVSENADKWIWTDGTCMDYQNWFERQPSGRREDPRGFTCMEMLGECSGSCSGDDSDGTQWNDLRCDTNPLAGVYRCCL